MTMSGRSSALTRPSALTRSASHIGDHRSYATVDKYVVSSGVSCHLTERMQKTHDLFVGLTDLQEIDAFVTSFELINLLSSSDKFFNVQLLRVFAVSMNQILLDRA